MTRSCKHCGEPLVKRIEANGKAESDRMFGKRQFCNQPCHFAYANRPESATKRFMARVTKTETCWLWNGAQDVNGYGDCHFRGKCDGAHRVSWRIHNGEIPAGIFVLHRCDVPLCVNPAHLFLGTHSDNMRDASAKGRLRTPNRWAARMELFS